MDKLIVEDGFIVVAPRKELDYYHVDQMVIGDDIDPLSIYEKMTTYSPLWLRVAFKIRDGVCSIFNLKAIGGFSKETSRGNVTGGGKLDFFDVRKSSDKELILSASDKHLIIVLSLHLHKTSDKKRLLSVVTSVKTHGLLGQVYMIPVAPVHPTIIKNMLKKL